MMVWDEESCGHCLRSADYAEAIARQLKLDDGDVEMARVGSLLHDIGKMGLDLSVLKKEGRFEDFEFEHIREHPAMGAAILARVLPESIVACARYHHEQPDGRGYPDGLYESEIPLAALICRVADVIDSLTSPQSYRPALTIEETVVELRAGAGTLYSERVVEAALELIERREIRPAA
jgi:putative nucleotidyltransferase with HDIG domain